ncbi:hypothetical protein QFZ71_000627 [Streptomyces sp. V2I9]|nr:hypothetical protein [Streptomyces sp. V2I9]
MRKPVGWASPTGPSTRILSCSHPAYALTTGHSDEGAGGRPGGLPDLPSGMTRDGEGLLVASIDLAALPSRSLDTGLPGDGRLLLFAGPFADLIDLDDLWPPSFPHALYVPPGTETTPWKPPMGGSRMMNTSSRGGRCTRGPSGTWMSTTPPRPWTRQSRSSGRTPDTTRAPSVLNGCHDLKLGGTAQAQQDTVEGEVLGRVGTRRGQPWEDDPDAGPSQDGPDLIDREELGSAWKPLAEGSRSGTFGEGDGALYWLTPRTDLAKARFDRTELVHQC